MIPGTSPSPVLTWRPLWEEGRKKEPAQVSWGCKHSTAEDWTSCTWSQPPAQLPTAIPPLAENREATSPCWDFLKTPAKKTKRNAQCAAHFSTKQETFPMAPACKPKQLRASVSKGEQTRVGFYNLLPLLRWTHTWYPIVCRTVKK